MRLVLFLLLLLLLLRLMLWLLVRLLMLMVLLRVLLRVVNVATAKNVKARRSEAVSDVRAISAAIRNHVVIEIIN